MLMNTRQCDSATNCRILMINVKFARGHITLFPALSRIVLSTVIYSSAQSDCPQTECVVSLLHGTPVAVWDEESQQLSRQSCQHHMLVEISRC